MEAKALEDDGEGFVKMKRRGLAEHRHEDVIKIVVPVAKIGRMVKRWKRECIKFRVSFGKHSLG